MLTCSQTHIHYAQIKSLCNTNIYKYRQKYYIYKNFKHKLSEFSQHRKKTKKYIRFIITHNAIYQDIFRCLKAYSYSFYNTYVYPH